jgi:hypothetical protein
MTNKNFDFFDFVENEMFKSWNRPVKEVKG